MRSLATKSALVAGAIALSISAFADFTKTASVPQVTEEVAARLKKAESVDDIVKAGLAGGVSAETLTTVLLSLGKGAAEIITSIASNTSGNVASSSAAIKAAVAAKSIEVGAAQQAAISGGADPTALLTATASGGGDGGGTQAAGQNGGNSGTSFSGAQTSTNSGGGGAGVSRS